MGREGGPGAWSLLALWPDQPGPPVPPCLSPGTPGACGPGSPHGHAGAKASGESPAELPPTLGFGGFAWGAGKPEPVWPLCWSSWWMLNVRSRPHRPHPAWSPIEQATVFRLTLLSLSTGRSQRTPWSTAGSATRTQWCRTGTATAGTVPTASSTTASRRCGRAQGPVPHHSPASLL